jgi:hypothetical protein
MKKIIQIKIIDFQPLENLAERITLGKSEFSFVLQTVDKTFCGKLYRAAFIYNYEFQNLDSLEEYLKYFAYNAPYLFKSF